MEKRQQLLIAINELIQASDDENEWEKTIKKFPELSETDTVKMMRKIVSSFDEATLLEIIDHWNMRILFLEKRKRPAKR